MRPSLLALAALVLAGCVSTPAPAPAAAPQHAALGGWLLDCALGGYEHARNASWNQTCEARASHTPGPKEETWIGVNPTNPLNVVVGAKDLNPANSAHCVWNGVFVTHDGGRSWKDVVIGGDYASRQADPTNPFFGYACNTDPDFRFDTKGQLHYGVEMYNFLGQDSSDTLVSTPAGNVSPPVAHGFKILLATSHDGGDTWPDVITFQPDLLYTTDYSRMTIDPTTDAIIESIGSDGGEGCHVLVSLDGGKTAQLFTEVVTTYGPPCDSGADNAIAASPKGVVTLVGGQVHDPTAVLGSQPPQAIVVRSTDDGQTWLDANPGFTIQPIPHFNESKYRDGSVTELAYDLTKGPRAGTLYACTPEAGRDEADIFVRSSPDDGRTWGNATRVNGDAPGPHQWMCNIAVAGDGSVHTFWMDKRWDPAHKLIDLMHAASFDGGKTWSEERVSSVSYDGDLGVHQDGFPFIGDYLGVAAGGDDVWAGFPDASNGQTTVVAAAHVHRAG